MKDAAVKIAIIGGGITGLTAAYYVQRFFKAQQLPVQITLVEKSPVLGGKIQTLRRDGFCIERGPDSFLVRKQAIVDLALDLGMQDSLVRTGSHAKKTYIVRNGCFHRIPQGFTLGIPTQITPFLGTGLLSWKGKLRAGLELFLPPRQDNTDESVGHFLERRLGKEVVSRVAEPLLSGIYAGDLYTLSVQATFPQFHQLERKYGSLIRGMIADKKVSSAKSSLPAFAQNANFMTFQNGLSSLVEVLSEKLSDLQILKGVGVLKIEKNTDAYQVSLEDGTQLHTNGVILTTSPNNAKNLLPAVPFPKLVEVSVANVILAFHRKDILHPLDSAGFVLPKTEGRTITACTLTSSKWPHTAPSDKVLLRCYVGRLGDEAVVDWSDERLLQQVKKELRELLGIDAQPIFTDINRLRNGLPQYPLGHRESLANLQSFLANHYPGVYFAGMGYDGVGIPDCIRQAKEAATTMAQHFSKSKLTSIERSLQ